MILQRLIEKDVAIVVESDFFEDLRTEFAEKLSGLGVVLAANRTDLRSTLIAYFNVQWRLISRRPRMALVSPQLTSSRGNDPRLEQIIAEIEAGEDLTPRLSKGVFAKPFYNDRQLNDWGIRHLHVGPKANPHSNELLYVYVTDAAIHLIDWQAHGVASFADQGLVEALHENWPRGCP